MHILKTEAESLESFNFLSDREVPEKSLQKDVGFLCRFLLLHFFWSSSSARKQNQ